MYQHIFFHGTRLEFLESILKSGLKIRDGRATFIEHPKYALKYSGENPIKEGILLVVKSRNIKPAEDSFIKFDNENKLITGWPNRWRTEQFGYFGSNKTRILKKKYIIGAYRYNRNFIKLNENVLWKILKGNVSEKSILKWIKSFEKFFDKKNLIKTKISAHEMAQKAVLGMVRNLILRETRANYVSSLILNGWKIHNPGQVPCDKWFKTKEEMEKQNSKFKEIINQNFIPKDVRLEFNKYQRM